MYKFLLCWRYLRTRWIALICIISVTLGVATMIVVNSVMAGFTIKTQAEMCAMLGDLQVEARTMDGVADAPAHMAVIHRAVGDDVVGMTPTVAVPSLVYMEVNGMLVTTPVTLVGIDEATFASVTNIKNYFQHPDNRARLSFTLRDSGYDLVNHQAETVDAAKPRPELGDSGRDYRRRKAAAQRMLRMQQARAEQEALDRTRDPFMAGTVGAEHDQTPVGTPTAAAQEGRDFNPAIDEHPGIILAISDCSFRDLEDNTRFYNRPGDDVRISFPKASLPAEIISEFYTIVDVYQDSIPVDSAGLAFVSLGNLQRGRGMIDPTTGVGKFTSLLIKLRPGANAEVVRDKIRNVLPADMFTVSTWQDRQALVLKAIKTETKLLNIMLFMIVAVAGFGILSIFSMIVVEKTRDIGILKSLGASGRGIMAIFLLYGLSLGVVGAGAGTALGVAFANNINDIKDFIERVQGEPVFDRSVYFFDKIPSIVEPLTVAWITAGAVAIAVLSSVLPARRAARLHPVRALRFE
jgi:lipoprotein-releasing system permease protein